MASGEKVEEENPKKVQEGSMVEGEISKRRF